MKALKVSDNRVVYADKEKMFRKVLAMQIPIHQWQSAITTLCKDEDNNWAYNEVNRNKHIKFKVNKV